MSDKIGVIIAGQWIECHPDSALIVSNHVDTTEEIPQLWYRGLEPISFNASLNAGTI